VGKQLQVQDFNR